MNIKKLSFKEKGTGLAAMIFILTLLFATPLILSSANYGEGAYGAGVYGQTSCGDNVCDASESCSSCNEDCGICPVSESGGGIIERDYIEKAHLWTEIKPETTAIMNGFDGDFGINEIRIEVSGKVNDTKIIVRKYHSKPDKIPEAPGIVYKYLQIETENLKNLKEAVINSKVNKSWISENNVQNISLWKLNESSNEWIKLDTIFSNESDDFNFYETSLSSFSYFAISGESLIPSVPGEGLISEEAPGANLTILGRVAFGIVLAVILISSLIVLSARIKRKKEFEKFVENQKSNYAVDYMRAYNELDEIVKRHEPNAQNKYLDVYYKLKRNNERRNRLIEEYKTKLETGNLKIPATLAIISVLLFSYVLLSFAPVDFSITGFAADGRLPTIGSDGGNWGTVLNNYLQQEHTINGSHKNVSVAGYLNVSGDANISQNLIVDTNTLFVDSAGNFVGIGTAVPDADLHIVNNDGADALGILIQRTSTTTGMYGLYIAPSGDFIINDHEALVPRLIIQKTTGNVGIGTSSPTTKLDVAGNINASNLRTFDLIRNNAPSVTTTSATYATLASSASVNFNGRPTLFLLSMSNFIDVAANTNTDYAINIDGGADNFVVNNFINPITTHTPISLYIILTPSAGNHVINVRWRRSQGTGIVSMDENDHIHLAAVEL